MFMSARPKYRHRYTGGMPAPSIAMLMSIRLREEIA